MAHLPDPDKRFARMMIKHHQNALAMAKEFLEVGTNPTLRAIARAILDSQAEEIGTMQRLLRES